MVLVQFLITSSNNNTMFPVPISGKCCIRVLNMVYHSTGANTICEAIQLQSDALVFPYSPLRYLTLISNPSAALNYDQGYVEYNLQNVVLNGQIWFNVLQSNGSAATNFDKLLVTLEIEKMNETFIPGIENGERRFATSG